MDLMVLERVSLLTHHLIWVDTCIQLQTITSFSH